MVTGLVTSVSVRNARWITDRRSFGIINVELSDGRDDTVWAVILMGTKIRVTNTYHTLGLKGFVEVIEITASGWALV